MSSAVVVIGALRVNIIGKPQTGNDLLCMQSAFDRVLSEDRTLSMQILKRVSEIKQLYNLQLFL